MKYIILLLTVLLTISLSYACTVELITTTNENYSVNENILINVTTSNNCENYSLNVYSVDLMNLEEETIYDGKITNNEMEFTTKITEPTVKKIYATTYTNNVTKKLNKTKDTIKYTPIVTTIEFGKMYTIFQSLRGVTDPETYEYGPMDINLRVYNQSGGTRTTTFGFYFLNNDFNITFLTPDYNNCTKLPGYPYSCEFPEKTLLPGQNIYPKVRLTNFKYNDIIFTFGQDGPILYDLNKPIFSKPFITVKDWNVTNNVFGVDYNLYNHEDINFCSLIVNGEEKQRNYNIELDNQFVQDINSGDNTIDINCYTDVNHYTYPSPRYDPVYAQAQPSVDNVLITLDSSIFVSKSEFSDGNGSIENPYKLSNCSQLQLLENYSNSNFVLNQDIDCNGFDFEPINDFTGYFDGNGKTIINLTINKPEQNNVGLFSKLSGTITRIGLIDVNIIGYEAVGGITGINNGLIEQVFVTGTIRGNDNVGGITGTNERIEVNDGFPYNGSSINNDILKEINNSYTIVNITGDTAGGITGYNRGKILNVYSLGTINGIATGGLAGKNYTRCYPYTHFIRSGIINYSFSTINTTASNSCYSTWYYGSGAQENGNIQNTIVDPDENYLSNNNNTPFNRWDFNNIWKMEESGERRSLSVETYPVLSWE